MYSFDNHIEAVRGHFVRISYHPSRLRKSTLLSTPQAHQFSHILFSLAPISRRHSPIFWF